MGTPEAVAEVRELTIPVAGGSIAARFYAPNVNPSGLIVYYHGGGWVVGSLDTHDMPLRALANLTGAGVLSVAYRLAPEHPFPTPPEDCYAALVWARQHQAELVGDAQPLLVAGDSAGGNLAAVVALLARDRQGPKIAWQVLIYPSTDGRCDTPSYTEHASGGLLTRQDMQWFWYHYVPDHSRRVDPKASPIAAEHHRDLPPAIVVIAEFDPLRDEGIAYAERLRAAGNQVSVLKYDTLPHGFISYLYLVGAANAALREIAQHLRTAIAGAGKKAWIK